MIFTVSVKIPDLSFVDKTWRTKTANGLNKMANDLMVNSIPKTPLKSGALRRNRRKSNVSDTEVRVQWLQPYASYQERGRRYDGSHVVRGYTTPGTGRQFVANALSPIKRNSRGYFR